ncbi:hypothetical protein [Candidatus Poriferisocius sp.]|uniref:hypothetical protein n=1 Tax=Candidatus Poriferisocius sp. TaxID=3101276 RepID=UPI003B02B1BD
MGPAPSGSPLDSLGAAPAAAAPSSPGPVTSDSHSPAVSFTAMDYPVGFWQRIFGATEPADSSSPQLKAPTGTFTFAWFGEVTAYERSDDLDLLFAVEHQQDPSGYQFCASPDICGDVNVAVTPEGLLYLQWPLPHADFGYFADFPARSVEVSAADAASSLKVYREVLVGPPTAESGCEDYGVNNPDAYACLFLREVIPKGFGDSSNEATLRAKLPSLVQDAANYNLVFSEEFNGTLPAANAAGCIDGLSTLDTDVWSYRDACDNIDSRGETCGNVVNGHLVIGATGTCYNEKISTHGNLHAKYGYFEVKYTVNARRWPQFANLNVVLHARGERLRGLFDRYGVDIDNWEDYLTNVDVEVDLVEYDAQNRQDVSHQYGNWAFNFRNADMEPIRTVKWNRYCGGFYSITNNPNLPCRATDTFTVTRGVEWTPRGYRTFVKVDGITDDMIVVPEDKIGVEVRRVIDGEIRYREGLGGSDKDKYFEYLDPEDPDTLLEQVVVSHVPLPIAIGTWGWLGEKHPYIRTRMKVDHVRLWQPENHYSDMEPVFQ